MATSAMDDLSLNALFRTALLSSFSIENSTLESNSAEFQKLVKDTILKLQQCTEGINQLNLFSANENVEDIQTSHLKFLLTPALLGSLTSKLITGRGGGVERLEQVRLANIYYRDFMERLLTYKLTSITLPNVQDEAASTSQVVSSQPSLEDMARERGEKIRRYNENKQLDEEITKLCYILSEDRENQLDDEVVRDFYMKLIRRWINVAVEEVKSLSMEMQMLQMFAGKTAAEVRGNHKPPERAKPFIITKNELQKQVFGLGYPSRPIMTIEEFVNTKIEDGSLSVASEQYQHSLQNWVNDPEGRVNDEELEEEKKEILVEKDDEVHLIRERNWDDWKDEHKRGEGNRHNMG